MKKLLMTLSLAIIISAFGYCLYDVQASPNCNILNRQGCCSHHSGVCGCSNGRAMCCDGTLSPSCSCY